MDQAQDDHTHRVAPSLRPEPLTLPPDVGRKDGDPIGEEGDEHHSAEQRHPRNEVERERTDRVWTSCAAVASPTL